MEPPALSRREVLASLGGIGAAGAIGGAGTRALLSADASESGAIRAGTLSVSDGDGGRELSFSVRNIDRGQSGEERLEVAVEHNPAWLWLRSYCPRPHDPLGDALRVRLRWGGDAIGSGTLSSVRRSLARGRLLGGGCTDAGRTSLEFEWYLPAGTPDAVAGEKTDIGFELFAEQCRHNDVGGTSNPFSGIAECDERRECVPCEERIASASFEYDGPDTATVELIRGGRGTGSGDVLATEAVDPGDSFTALLHDPPAVRGGADVDIVVDGTRIGDFHISCSEPFGPGLVVGDGTYSLTVLDATDTDGNTICEVEA